jgi:hypothetical protein
MSHFVSLESRLRLHAAWWVPFVGILMCPCEGKAQDQWTAMSIVDVPVARWRHTAVWTTQRSGRCTQLGRRLRPHNGRLDANDPGVRASTPPESHGGVDRVENDRLGGTGRGVGRSIHRATLLPGPAPLRCRTGRLLLRHTLPGRRHSRPKPRSQRWTRATCRCDPQLRCRGALRRPADGHVGFGERNGGSADRPRVSDPLPGRCSRSALGKHGELRHGRDTRQQRSRSAFCRGRHDQREERVCGGSSLRLGREWVLPVAADTYDSLREVRHPRPLDVLHARLIQPLQPCRRTIRPASWVSHAAQGDPGDPPSVLASRHTLVLCGAETSC